MTVGEKIKMYRSLFNVTQKELAERSGVSEISIRKYEAGERNPKLEQIRKIAHALEWPEEEFFELPYKETTDVKTVGDVMSILLLLEEKVGIDYFFKHNKWASITQVDPMTLTIRFKDERINKYLAEWVETKTLHDENIERTRAAKNEWGWSDAKAEESIALEMMYIEDLRKELITDPQPLARSRKKKD